MNKFFSHSLILSLGIVMATITLLAFASMAASLFIADTIQGEATAINLSGALRMRSYQISNNLVYDVLDEEHWKDTNKLLIEFEQHLNSDELLNIIPQDENNNIHVAYKRIQTQWQERILPLFDIYLNEMSSEQQLNLSISKDAITNIRNQYRLVVTQFVADIDYLVSLLEEDAESNIQRLRSYQFISLLLTIALVITALILVYKRVHIPMKQLLKGAQLVSNSDFSYVTPYTGQDELGQLGQAYNSMAKDLSEIYTDLEERVRQKTMDLERGNCSMELLYKTVKRLNEAISPHHTFPFILKDIENLIGTDSGAICLSTKSQDEGVMLSSTFDKNDISKYICNNTECKNCQTKERTQFVEITNKQGNTANMITIPICNHNINYGLLMIEPKNNHSIEDWQKILLESIADHIGIAINLSHQISESRRLSLMEERGVIARELHDSLAQSLTYMKIQLSRLSALLKNSDIELEAENVIDELKVGLSSAYRELRELLTTFRLKIDGEDFKGVLDKTVSEFNNRSDTKINCTNDIAYFDLTANEEIHILQLIREALSNVVQHANASIANIHLQCDDSGDICIRVIDNGEGIQINNSRQHHYGLSIMKERAQTLNGTFDISKNRDAGTTVELTFSPCNKDVTQIH
jgi:two-component system, NarL family, nitrate/nitrite sensor histidine kinase NarX